MEPTVSIIIPVYNGEKTLERCVESILNQTYRDFELLLIDDGSRDGTAALCDRYGDADSRVRVFHQENAGVSASRNLALDQAQGTYLQFVDCDDWITSDATRSLVQAAKEHDCDLVISDFYRVVGERVSHKGDIDETGVMDREEFAAYMMEDPADFYYGVLWNKLYRADLVREQKLRMDPQLNWCEDFMFNLEYLRFAQRIIALQVPIYYYVKTKGSLASQGMSLTKTVRMKRLVFEYYNRFFKAVLDEKEYERCRLKVYRFLVDVAGDGVVLPAILPGSARLGTERFQVSADILAGEGLLYDAFRQRKMLDRFLETAAIKHGVTLPQARLLLHLRHVDVPATRRELADFANLTLSAFNMQIQKLVSRGLVRLEEAESSTKRGARRLQVVFQPEAAPVLADLAAAVLDYRQTVFQGFSQEELARYEELSGKIQDNIRASL